MTQDSARCAKRYWAHLGATLLLGFCGRAVADEMPSVRLNTAPLVTSTDAWAFYGNATTHTNGAFAWQPAPPEAIAVADGLGAGRVRAGQLTESAYVERVTEYVRNNIDVEFRFGLGKGARGAIIDQSGTAFDQAQLMMTLLREANVMASYQLGTITLDAQQFGQWTGLVTNLFQGSPPSFSVNARAACQFLADGGIPATVNGASSCSGLTGNLTTVTLAHLWIASGGKLYDPAFKRYNLRSGVDLALRMGCGSVAAPTCATLANDAALSGAISGQFAGATTLAHLNNAQLETQLRAFAVTLKGYVQANLPDAGLEELIGGRLPDSSYAPAPAAVLPYTSTLRTSWTGEIPDQYRTRLRLHFRSNDVMLFADELYGRRIEWVVTYDSFSGGPLSLTVDNATLLSDAVPLFPGGADDVYDSVVDHPYAAAGGTYADATRAFELAPVNGAQVVFFSLGNSGAGLPRFKAERERVQPGNLHLVPVLDSVPVVQETRDVTPTVLVGAQLLYQSSLAVRAIAGVSKTHVTQHHAIGTTAATGRGAFSLETTLSVISRNNDAPARQAAFANLAAVTAVMEGSVMQQEQDSFVPVDTAAQFYLANTQDIPFIDVPTDKVTPLLADPSLGYLAGMAANGYRFIVPQRRIADIPINPAQDFRYQTVTQPVLAYRDDSMAYLIGPRTKGGGAAPGPDDPLALALNAVKPAEKGLRDRSAVNVNLASGELVFNAAPDLVTGVGDFPAALSFQRSYTSSAVNGLNFRKFVRSGNYPGLEGGWTHNFQISASLDNDGARGLGELRALDAVAAVAALYTVHDLARTPDFSRRLTAALTTHWLSQRFINNAVTVRRGPSSTTFVRLPSGEFAAPRGSADRLEQTGSRAGPLCAGQCRHEPPRAPEELFTFFPEPPTAYDYDAVTLLFTDSQGAVLTFKSGETFQRTEEITGASNYPIRRPSFVPETWLFPNGVQLKFTYQLDAPVLDPRQRRMMKSVTNNLGRSLTFELIDDVHVRGVITAVVDDNNRRATFGSDTFRGIDFALSCPASLMSGLPRCTAPNRYTVTTPDGAKTIYDYVSAQSNADPFIPATYRLRRWFTPDDANVPFLSFEYDTGFRARSIVDKLAQRTEYFSTALFGQEQTRGELLDALGAVTTQYFNRNGKVLAIIDPLLRTTRNTYDAAGRVSRTVNPEGDEATYQFDSRSNLTLSTRKAKLGSGLSDVVIRAVYPATCQSPATCNQPSSTTDARGQVTSFTYDDATGQLRTISRSLGGSTGTALTTLCYDSVATSTGPALKLLVGKIDRVNSTTNRVTRYSYDYANKFVLASASVDPRASLAPPATSSSRCDAADKPAALNFTTSLSFDAVGNLRSVDGSRSGPGDTTTYTFDQMRRLKRITAPLGAITAYEYLADGALSKTHRARVANPVDSNPAHWFTEVRSYYPTGDLSSITDPEGNERSFMYDSNGRQVLETDPDGASSSTVYDAAGQVRCSWKGLTSAVPRTDCTWDPATHAAADNDGAYRYAAYTYSDNGKQLSVQDANNNITGYAYDGLDRLVFTFFPDPVTGTRCTLPTAFSTTPTCTGAQTYEKSTYDANDNRLSLRTRKGDAITWIYDGANRIRTKTTTGLPVVTYGYDLLNQVVSITSPAGTAIPAHRVSYDYNDAGQRLYEENLINGTARRVSYLFDEANNRVRTTWPDGYFVSYEYDALNRMSAAWEGAVGTTKLADYSYDFTSRRTQLQYAGQPSNRILYSYESDSNLDVLTHVLNGTTLTLDHGSSKSGRVTSIAASDNFFLPSAAGDSSTAYAPDKLNRYAVVGGQAATYDGAGNLLTWFPAAGKHTYTYDAENQLRTVAVNGSATASISYDYDALGRRLCKTVSGTLTCYVLDGDEEIAEVSGTGTVLRRYLTGPGIDDRIAVAEGSALSNPPKTYYHLNHQASVIGTTDASGSLTCAAGVNCQRLGYDEYGRLGAGSVATGQPYRYTGRRYDEETGLYYYRTRYYSPELGRFLQTDRIGYEGDLNLYAYTGNDPVNATDPTGECGITMTTPCTPKQILVEGAAANAIGGALLLPTTKNDYGVPTATPLAKGLLFEFLTGTGKPYQEFGPDSPETAELLQNPYFIEVTQDLIKQMAQSQQGVIGNGTFFIGNPKAVRPYNAYDAVADVLVRGIDVGTFVGTFTYGVIITSAHGELTFNAENVTTLTSFACGNLCKTKGIVDPTSGPFATKIQTFKFILPIPLEYRPTRDDDGESLP